MCLEFESKLQPIKPQYENGEVVCYVVAQKRNGKCYAEFGKREYKMGKRMKAIMYKSSKHFIIQENYYGRHGFLTKEGAENWAGATYNAVIIKANVKLGDIIFYGSTCGFSALRATAMFYQKEVN